MDYAKYYLALDTLIELNIENQKEKARMKLELSSALWAETVCTVRCNIGRCTGATSYIMERAKPGDLIVTHANWMSNNFRKFINPQCDISSAEELEKNSIFKHYNTVWVDDPDLVFARIKPQKFYELLADSEGQVFVLLGSLRPY